MFGLGRLLALPYSLPASGVAYCFRKIAEVADQELWDDAPVKEELLLLQLQLEEGEIDEAEFRPREAALLVRLREIKQRRKEQLEAEMAERLTEEAEGKRRVVIETPDELR